MTDLPDAIEPTLLLHEVFDRTLARHPNRVAIDVPAPLGSTGHRRLRLTYAELDALATRLQENMETWLRLEEPVAILLPRSAPTLYAAQLAVHRAGGAFLCLDRSFPDEHMRAVLADAAVRLVITDDLGWERLSDPDTRPELGLLVNETGNRVSALPSESNRSPASPAPESVAGGAPIGGGGLPPATRDDRLAYLIYTSGTTGAPKGVLLTHRGIVNLVLSDQRALGIGPQDRVAQLSSPAYDSSIEETWLAFAVGATLVPIDDLTLRAGPDLVPWLAHEGITVLCPPPTLLRTLVCEDPALALPALRLLYVGGEPMPPDLVALWAPGRRIVNGYGPTECTVVVTRAELRPGRPVTIGYPIDGHEAWIVDETFEELPAGEAGELCFGGPGLARGYLGRPEATAERFIDHPQWGRIYRTGDLARLDADGALHFLGRIDGQVKLRGYRIELGAVEAALAALPGVHAAGCQLQGEGARRLLAAHLVAEGPGDPPELTELARLLRAELPEYMVPARLQWCEALPTTTGGKLDRRALPEIGSEGAARADMAGSSPAGPIQRSIPHAKDRRPGHSTDSAHLTQAAGDDPLAVALARQVRVVLDLPALPEASAHFFKDLGGDSLSAVALVTSWRETESGLPLAVRDIYEGSTLQGIAQRIEGAASVDPEAREAVFAATTTLPVGRARPLLATWLQGLWLITGLALSSALAAWLLLSLLPPIVTAAGPIGSMVLLTILVPILWLVSLPLSVLLTVGAKRLLIGRYREGVVPVWSSGFVRHWVVTRIAATIPWNLVEGTVFTGSVLRALGADVGERVHFHRGVKLGGGGWDLLTIGDDATIAQDAALRTVDLESRMLVLGPVKVGQGALVDVRAGMAPGSELGADAHLTPLSWLPSGGRVAAAERGHGVPARPDGPAEAAPAPGPARSLRPEVHGALTVLLRLGRPVLVAVPALSSLSLLSWWQGLSAGGVAAWLNAPVLSTGWLLGLSLLAMILLPSHLFLLALLYRLAGRVKPDVYGRWGLGAMRIWWKSGLVASAGRWLAGSLYWPLWLRAAGMRIGPRSEVSTIIDVLPETVTIGAESFFADGIYLCPPTVRRGTITVAETSIGDRTFLGNHAVLPAGVVWPPGLFVGVATQPEGAQVTAHSGWFGHPAMELLRRDVVEADRELTHEPPLRRYLVRLAWETLRFGLPVVPMWTAGWWVWLIAETGGRWSAAWFYGIVAPLAGLLALALPVLCTIALKWLLLGRVRAGRHAFWSGWCARWDFLYMAWQSWARGSLALLSGTLLQNAVLRAFGMRIGRRVVLGDGFAQVVDPDMLHFADEATVNCDFQAHTFEDRILKIDHVTIGRGASVGPGTVVFYGARIGPKAMVSPQGVVMKNERLRGGERYVGQPVASQEGRALGAE